MAIFRSLSAALVALLLASCAAVGARHIVDAGTGGRAPSADWPQFGENAAHTSFNAGETTISRANVGTLTPAWSNQDHASELVATQDGVYDEAGAYIFKRDPSSGAILWKRTEFAIGMAVDGGVAYAISDPDYGILAVDASSGVIRWTGEAPAHQGSAVVAKGIIFIGVDKLYAFSAAGCNALRCMAVWAGATPEDVGTPMVAAGKVIVAGESGRVYAFPAAGCGQLLCDPIWTAPAGGSRATPVSDGSRVFLGGTDLRALDLATGALLWTDAVDMYPWQPPAVASGTVFAGSGSQLLAVSASNGVPLWSEPGSKATPAVANGVVFATTTAAVVAYNTKNGSKLWTSPSGEYFTPVVANGTLYISNTSSGLTAYRPQS
jgi:hypothetical protein